jgi:hypothetical protein
LAAVSSAATLTNQRSIGLAKGQLDKPEMRAAILRGTEVHLAATPRRPAEQIRPRLHQAGRFQTTWAEAGSSGA